MDTVAETSRAAFEAIKPHRHIQHVQILEAFDRLDRDLAAEEIADFTGMTHVQIGRRMIELERDGVVARTEARHTNRSGRSAYKYTCYV